MSDDKSKQSQVQGEGDRESARQYNEATRDFVESGKVDEAAKKAGEQDPAEAEQAEKEGRERARGEDSALRPDSD